MSASRTPSSGIPNLPLAPRPGARPDRTFAHRLRVGVRTVGEVFLTLGLVLLLLCAYQLWWTNVESAAATQREQEAIVQQWAQEPEPAVEIPKIGKGFALLYIPRLRDKVWGLPIIQGVGLDVLAKGAGHYPKTALPGEVGNFALAAHRATHNEPFRDIDRLRVGDKVYVQTDTTWYTYVLDRDRIVQPTDVWVIDPVPGKQVTPTEKLITLTTCNPRWASYERWIWWGEQVNERPVTDGPPDRLEGAL